jgi:hypothetical protein
MTQPPAALQTDLPEAKALSALPTPPEVTAALQRHCAALKSATGDKLVCLALYGGVVRGRYRPQESDINLLLVLKDTSKEILDRLAPVLRAAWREIHLEPWLLGTDEIEGAARVFPTKVLDIQRYHQLLDGADALRRIEVRREDLCRRIEQEMRNIAMRLRRRYLSIYDDEDAMRRALTDVAVPLRINLLALLDLAEVKVAEEQRTAAVYSTAAKHFQLDANDLQQLSDLRNTGSLAGDAGSLFCAVMMVVEKIAAIVTQMRVAS